MIFYLIYISKTANLMRQKELEKLLYYSRERNKRRDITGLLLYVEGNFMDNDDRNLTRKLSGRFIQIIEGNETEVRALYNSIQHDSRHTHIILLKEAEIATRNFGEWSMGFCAAHIKQEDTGFADLENVFLESEKSDYFNRPLAFLASFYQMSKTKL